MIIKFGLQTVRNGLNYLLYFKARFLQVKTAKHGLHKPHHGHPGALQPHVCIKGKVFMTGGKYGGFAKDGRTTESVYSYDVWTMEKR